MAIHPRKIDRIHIQAADQIIKRRRLKAELQTLISNFRAAPFISLNAVSNGVELRDESAAHLGLFGFGKTGSQERAPTLIYWRLTTDNWPRASARYGDQAQVVSGRKSQVFSRVAPPPDRAESRAFR